MARFSKQSDSRISASCKAGEKSKFHTGWSWNEFLIRTCDAFSRICWKSIWGLPRSVFSAYARSAFSRSSRKSTTGFTQHHFYYNKSGAGFTFVEALIAMSLIIIAFVNVLSITSFALGRIREARDSMVASYLAQEGIELAAALRDENWLNNRPFDSSITNGTYRMDYLGTIDASAGSPLLFDQQKGFQYTTGVPTSFIRRVTFSKPKAYIVKVQSQVSWTARGTTRSMVVEDNLYNWLSI